LLEAVSFEVPAESVGTVTGPQRWRQRIPNFKRCKLQQKSYERLLLYMRTERWAQLAKDRCERQMGKLL